MKPTETQIEAAARADFLEEGTYDKIIYDSARDEWCAVYLDEVNFMHWHGISCVIPDYANDHNAVQRLIDGLSTAECDEYWGELYLIAGTTYEKLCKATAAQKFKAVCMAKGWE